MSNILDLVDKLSNPPAIIRHYMVDDLTMISVVRDDLLEAGTKQRAIIRTLRDSIGDKDGFVYAGPPNGYSQAAISFGCKYLGKKCNLFIMSSDREYTPSVIAREYGAEIKIISDSLKNIQEIARIYARDNNLVYLEFGLDTDIFRDNLFSSLSRVGLNLDYSGTIWLAVGSGTLLSVLMKLFKRARFGVVIVGKKYESRDERIRIFVSPDKFYEDTKIQPPYNSSLSFDGKIWPIVLENAKDGDMIWNVAGN